MERIYSLTPLFCEQIPEDLDEGVLYISQKYGIAAHLCACGCAQKTITDLRPHWKNGWGISVTDGRVTLRPSIGNFNGENPYHAHYFITDNQIQWL